MTMVRMMVNNWRIEVVPFIQGEHYKIWIYCQNLYNKLVQFIEHEDKQLMPCRAFVPRLTTDKELQDNTCCSTNQSILCKLYIIRHFLWIHIFRIGCISVYTNNPFIMIVLFVWGTHYVTPFPVYLQMGLASLNCGFANFSLILVRYVL